MGGSKSAPAPVTPPPPPAASPVDFTKATPDPSRAHEYRGDAVGENTSGRVGGGLLVDATAKKQQALLGN